MSTNPTSKLLSSLWIALILGSLLFPIIAVPQEMADSVDRPAVHKEALQQAFDLLNITPAELGFDKLRARDDGSRLSIVDTLMNDPLSVPQYVSDWGEILDFIKHDFATGIFEISKDLDAPIGAEEVAALDYPIKIPPSTLPLSNYQAVQEILNGFRRADPWMDKALNSISESDREALLMIAPTLWEDEEDSTDNGLKGALHRAFGVDIDTTREINSDTLRAISAAFDRHALMMAGIAVLRGTQNALNSIDQLKDQEANVDVNGVTGKCLEHISTPWGDIVVGGAGDNTYYGDFALILDPGGNDNYHTRTAGAVGDLGNKYSVVIDLAGNDTYRSDSTLATLGTGILGIGVMIDLKGHDIYQSYHLSQGAGFFGIGILSDRDGWDTYRAGYFTQGAGQVGVGWLSDNAGNDVYTIDAWGQGFGSMFGFGIQADFSGSDTYRAGGRYFHHPLRPEDSRSFAQGFGMGFRPRGSGGIGLLYDREGNDFYNAEVFAQGTSYWYSVGMLLDRAGQDFYNAAQYSQGAGIHLAVGALIDEEGEDHYYSKFGPAQGEGHDYAVGVLIDYLGNDTYMVSGGQGIGLTNSVGIFIDGEGNDVYSTTEPGFGQGSARVGRSWSGTGIFLDLEGSDSYPDKMPGGDSLNWIQRDWGIGIDLPRDVIYPEDEVPEVVIQPEDTLRPIEDIFHDASLWEVSENRLKVRTAREALKLKEMDAVNYVFDNHLDTDNGLELRAIRALFEEYPDSVEERLIESITDTNRAIRGNAIYFLGILKLQNAVPYLLDLLEDKKSEKNWNGAIWALGWIADSTVVENVLPHLESDSEKRRINSAVALGKLKNTQAIEPLIGAFDDSIFTVRSAAVIALTTIGEPAFNKVLHHISNSESPNPLLVVTLGKIFEKIRKENVKKSEKIAKKMRKIAVLNINVTDPRLRFEVINLLARIGDKKSLKAIRSREPLEVHPLVKPAIERALGKAD